MKINDIVDVFVSYSNAQDGKTRPVLIVALSNNKAIVLKITTKYDKKSKYIKSFYYPILNWRKYNLDRPSYVDTKVFVTIDLTKTPIEKIRGHFTVEDMNRLVEFIKYQRQKM